MDKCKQCVELETQLDDLAKKVENLEKSNKLLEINISSLLLTAKGEVSRKDGMITDLRRQLDDKSFRRGKYRYDGQISKYKPAASDTSRVNIHTLPVCNRNNYVENTISPRETVNVSEINFISEPYIENDSEEDKKCEARTLVDTIFSQRLRKKLEDENVAKEKILESQELPLQKENEREEKMKNENNLQPLEELENACPAVMPENECNNVDNKENVSYLNQQLQRDASQSIVCSSNEENSIKNRPILVNKPSSSSSVKRSNEDYDETIKQVNKRTKTEDPLTEYDNLIREKWSIGNNEKLNELKEKTCGKKLDKTEHSSHDDRGLVSRRHYHISEQSEPVSTAQKKRRDFEKGEAITKTISIKEKDDFERERQHDEYDKCNKNKYKEKNDSERYIDKYEKCSERYRNIKYKDKVEFEKYDRYDDYDCNYRHEKLEKKKYDANQYGKRDKDEKLRYQQRERRKNDKYSKRSRRSESLSPERTVNNYYYKQKNMKNNDYKNNFEKRSLQNNTRHEVVNCRERLDRPKEKECNLIMDDFNFRRGRKFKDNKYCAGRSKSCGSGRNKRENELPNYDFKTFETNRSKDKELKINDANKKISLENYRSRKDQELTDNNKNDSSERNKRKEITEKEEKMKENIQISQNFKNKLENELINNCTQNVSKNKNYTNECLVESKITSYKSGKIDIVERDSGKKNNNSDTKLGGIVKESINNEQFLEDGEISEIPSSLSKNKISSFQFTENKNFPQSATVDISRDPLDDSQRNIENMKQNASGEKLKINSEEKSDSKKVDKQSLLQKLTFSVIDEYDKNKFPKDDKCDNMKLNPELLVSNDNDIVGENLKKNYIQKHVQSLDSFIESAERVLEENKEVYKAEQISREVANELREEIKLSNTEDTNKVQELPIIKETLSPGNERKNDMRTMSREDELEIKNKRTIIKEGKRHQQLLKLDEMEEEKNSSSPLNEKRVEIKENINHEFLNPVKENKIIESEKESLKNDCSVGESYSCSEVMKKKKESVVTEVVDLENDNKKQHQQQQQESESNALILGNISSSVKERRKHMKEAQKSVQVLQKSNKDVKFKEIKRQTQKPKEQVSDAKSKTKKSDGKQKKKIVIVKRRTRPVILTDTNASTTIVSKENIIMNIKLNTSGERNNLLS